MLKSSSLVIMVSLVYAFGISVARAEHVSDARSSVDNVDEACARDAKCIAKKLAQTLTSEHAQLVLAKVVDFEPGRLRVYSKGRERIQAIADSWKRHANWAGITVDGYSSASNRSEADNAALGQQRAEKIRGYLIRYGVAPEYVVAIGHAAGTQVDLSIETCARACRQ